MKKWSAIDESKYEYSTQEGFTTKYEDYISNSASFLAPMSLQVMKGHLN